MYVFSVFFVNQLVGREVFICCNYSTRFCAYRFRKQRLNQLACEHVPSRLSRPIKSRVEPTRGILVVLNYQITWRSKCQIHNENCTVLQRIRVQFDLYVLLKVLIIKESNVSSRFNCMAYVLPIYRISYRDKCKISQKRYKLVCIATT